MIKFLIVSIIITIPIIAFSGLISAQIYKGIEFHVDPEYYGPEKNTAGGTASINYNPKDSVIIKAKLWGLEPEIQYILSTNYEACVFETNKSGAANIQWKNDYMLITYIEIKSKYPDFDTILITDPLN